MNLGETGLHRLIGDIYDTALDESLWPHLLVQIADTLGADSAHLVRHEIRTTISA